MSSSPSEPVIQVCKVLQTAKREMSWALGRDPERVDAIREVCDEDKRKKYELTMVFRVPTIYRLPIWTTEMNYRVFTQWDGVLISYERVT